MTFWKIDIYVFYKKVLKNEINIYYNYDLFNINLIKRGVSRYTNISFLMQKIKIRRLR